MIHALNISIDIVFFCFFLIFAHGDSIVNFFLIDMCSVFFCLYDSFSKVREKFI